PKKVKRVRGKGRSLTARKAETIREMVSGGFRLDLLLETARLALSTYYYQLKQLDGHDKDEETKGEIQEIYYEH
ncbi:IS3 family transposase, partial [Streptococcus thermophilus]|nr:IS3 family transposase [Streptococcus thermophilus]